MLCSTEGWRLGPLPVAMGHMARPMLLSRSAAALPQDIVEDWILPDGRRLPWDSVHLAVLGAQGIHPAPTAHPRHLVIEGLAAGDGAANGVYRLESKRGEKPVYHKTDAVRTASLWFAAGDWRFGPSVEDGRVWAYATADQLSSDADWRSFDGQVQEVQILDARVAIPESISISGTEFVQEKRLCDARPVYRASLSKANATVKVYLYFRAHQSEWWLGPEVGGNEFLARAAGSLFQVIPRIEDLQWRQPVIDVIHESKEIEEIEEIEEDEEKWRRFIMKVIYSFITAVAGIILWSFRGVAKSTPSKEAALACVVCLEAPRQILLMPCRHVCCCKDCAERLERCPICRTETSSLAEVFL